MESTQARIRIGIDTGGTFTDIVAVDGASGAMQVTKVASTPHNPALALVRGVQAVLRQVGAPSEAVIGMAHGTTVATNALLQGEIGLARPDCYRRFSRHSGDCAAVGPGWLRQLLFLGKPERLVPLRMVREVGGRLNFRGEELRPLMEADVVAAARFFKAHGIRAVGVCLIYAYANGSHEQRVREIVQREIPNACCRFPPRCSGVSRIRARRYHAGGCVRQAAHGALSATREERAGRRAGRQAIPDHAVERRGNERRAGGTQADYDGALRAGRRGPGGAIIAQLTGYDNLVTLDAGGTSTDLCLIEDGKPHITNGGSVGSFPVRIPMINIETIGTGRWLAGLGLTAKAT